MKRIAAVLLVLVLAGGPAGAQGLAWTAGAAKATITPAGSMWMSGYGNRDHPSEGKETELWAKALVLEDAGGRRTLLVTLDLVGIPRDVSREICRVIEQKYGLARGGDVI